MSTATATKTPKVQLLSAPEASSETVLLESGAELLPTTLEPTIYASDESARAIIAGIREKVLAIVPDVSTKKGREAIASLAHKIARSKTALDRLGKSMVEEEKKTIAIIDARRRLIWDDLESLQHYFRAPLTQWEDAEKARVARGQGMIAGIEAVIADRGSSAQLKERLANLQQVAIDSELMEFEDAAHEARAKKVAELTLAIVAAEKAEAEAEELRQLRAEKTAREAKAREEAAAAEAAAKAVAAAEAKAKADADAAIAAERQRAQQAEAELQRAKAAAEAKALAETAAAANREHCESVRSVAADALASACGLSEAKARQVIQAIAAGMIPGVRVHYA